MKAREQRRDALDHIRAINGREALGRMAAAEVNGATVTKLEPTLMPVEEPALAKTRLVNLVEPELERNWIIARHGKAVEADTFRILRTKVMQLMTRNNMRSLGVTSPRYGDGKSNIAINLAMSIALDVKQTVCLVDLD